MNILDKTKRLLLPVMLLMLTAVPAIAEDVSFTAQAPQAVVKGDQFRISFKKTMCLCCKLFRRYKRPKSSRRKKKKTA